MVLAQLTFNEIREIRKGPLSRVFVAQDLQLNSDIVVKEIPKKDFNNPSEYYKEARILYSVKHPNIAEIQYACEDASNIYLSMPLYPQGSLENVYNNIPLRVKDMIRYSIEFLSGLHYIHTKGLVHLDVKPGNVLINHSDVAVLTDFGLTKYVNPQDLVEFEKVYLKHRSPEAYLSSFVGKQSDIYQAGVTLYRMVNGDNEFLKQFHSIRPQNIDGLRQQICQGNFPDRNYFLPHIPRPLQRVIKTALEVDTDNRYDSVLTMLNDLSKIDKNLDWYYNFDNASQTHVWTKDETQTVKSIRLLEVNGEWETEGKLLSKRTSKTSNFNLWNTKSHPDREKAFKIVAKMISDYEK